METLSVDGFRKRRMTRLISLSGSYCPRLRPTGHARAEFGFRKCPASCLGDKPCMVVWGLECSLVISSWLCYQAEGAGRPVSAPQVPTEGCVAEESESQGRTVPGKDTWQSV